MTIKNLLGLFVITITGFLLWSLKGLFIQIFAGIIIAMAICTITGKIKTLFSLSRSISLAITIIGIFLLLILSGIIIVPQFTTEFRQLIIQLPSAVNKLIEILIEIINGISAIIYGNEARIYLKNEMLLGVVDYLPDGVALANGITDSLIKLLDIASNLGSGIIQVLFILTIGLMISIQPRAYREIIILLFPTYYRNRAREIFLICGESLSNWMTGVLISSTFVALLAGIFLYILGIKLVVANALLAGALNIIPNVGPTISTIFPMSVALVDAPWKSLAVIGLYIIIQNLESYIITPSVMHHQVKMLPGLTLIAQFIFTIIFGPLGLLLSLPLAVVMQVFIREVLIIDILEKK